MKSLEIIRNLLKSCDFFKMRILSLISEVNILNKNCFLRITFYPVVLFFETIRFICLKGGEYHAYKYLERCKDILISYVHIKMCNSEEKSIQRNL